MKRLFLLLAMFLQAGGQPINIPISETAWQFGNSTRQEGNNLIAGSGGTFFQVLTKSPADLQEYKPGYTIPGFYTFTFSEVNYYQSYPGWYTAEIDFGTQEFCYAAGLGANTLTQITVVCSGPGYVIVDRQVNPDGATSLPVQGQQPFVIHFTVGGWPVVFSNVSMTFTQVD